MKQLVSRFLIFTVLISKKIEGRSNKIILNLIEATKSHDQVLITNPIYPGV